MGLYRASICPALRSHRDPIRSDPIRPDSTEGDRDRDPVRLLTYSEILLTSLRARARARVRKRVRVRIDIS